MLLRLLRGKPLCETVSLQSDSWTRLRDLEVLNASAEGFLVLGPRCSMVLLGILGQEETAWEITAPLLHRSRGCELGRAWSVTAGAALMN